MDLSVVNSDNYPNACPSNSDISSSTDDSTSRPDYGDFYLEVGYANPRCHQNMIKDRVRTEAYRKAIDTSQHLIKGKIVMDIGCGTGILSLFAAKAGAKRVFAVESSEIADSAKRIVEVNKLDHIITVIKNRLEDIQTLPDGIEKVDVIVSEFMGYSLFYESMIDSVVYARDKWLKPGGAILPDKCSLYIFGISDGHFKQHRIDYWNEVKIGDDKYYFPSFNKFAHGLAWRRIIHAKSQVVTKSAKLVDVDMNTVTIPELRIMKCRYKIPSISPTPVYCHALATYFTVEFSRCHIPITFSTAPWEKMTHWLQMVFYFRHDVQLLHGTTLSGHWAFRKNPRYFRDLQFSIHAKYDGDNEEFEETNIYKSH